MKKTITLIAVAFLAVSAAACGTPSKEDTCANCDTTERDACETVYDACDGNGDCIDALKNYCD